MTTAEPTTGAATGVTTAVAVTRVRVDDRGTGAPAAVRSGGGAFRVVTLDRGPARAHVALVPTTALLLAGDHVRIEVGVGAGCLLEITEPAGTVAYGMDGGEASWEVDLVVEGGGRLLWQSPELVVSEGARVLRSTRVALAGDAGCLLRETLVLGRAGELPGHAETRTDVTRDGVPVLVERLVADPSAQVPGVLGVHRVVDQVLDLPAGAAGEPGVPAPSEAGALRLAAGGTLHRTLAREAHESRLGETWAALSPERRGDGALPTAGPA
jgi:urease accessory protein